MQTKLYNIILVLGLIGLSACIEEYMPELKGYDQLLVVDGKITNTPGPYTIKLSNSTQLNNAAFTPHQGARVTIVDDQGNSEVLQEVENGIYQTDPDGIRGKIGTKYQINILTKTGKHYESGMEELKAPVPIKDVYAEFEQRQVIDNERFLQGLQFYLDTETTNENNNHFLWQLEETYKFHSDYKIHFIYAGFLKPVDNTDTLYTCWRTAPVEGIYSYTTANQQESVVKKLPLNFVSTETKRLTVKYSLLVKQFMISERAHNYWNNLEDQINNQGNLYSQQPYQINGNIINSNDESEPVLGYFMAAGESELRIFVDRPEDAYFYYPVCEPDEDIMMVLHSTPAANYPVYLTVAPGGDIAFADKNCLDCTHVGGNLNKPDFWPQN